MIELLAVYILGVFTPFLVERVALPILLKYLEEKGLVHVNKKEKKK